jgi:hypothetical protein
MGLRQIKDVARATALGAALSISSCLVADAPDPAQGAVAAAAGTSTGASGELPALAAGTTPGASGGGATGAGGADGLLPAAAGADGGADPISAAGGTEPAATPERFDVDISLSSAIATVGVVQWSIDTSIDQAYIDFGREPDRFELRAPVDLAEPDYRTLLLGMKPVTTYYVQVVAHGGGRAYASGVYSIETGFLPNGLPILTIDDRNAEALYGGFTINCTGVAASGVSVRGRDTWVFIFDGDGDYVWAYELTETAVSACSRARMSFDGKHMWVGNLSNTAPDGALLRVSMDGLSAAETYSLPGRHHDFTVLPNNNILYYEQENGGGFTDGEEGPDVIKELNPETGVTTQIYHQNTDFAQQIAEFGAHTAQINWVPHLNAVSFAMRHTSTIGLISYPAGQLIAVFGGPISDFDISWDIQHGHSILEDTILIFNNNGSSGGSSVLEYQYDLSTHSASKIFDYSSGNHSLGLGDVQRLPNGNTFVTYSSTGVIHEINSAGELLREITTDAIGYSMHRRTLYGPPPPVGE